MFALNFVYRSSGVLFNTYRNVLFNGFNSDLSKTEKRLVSIKLSHFQPVNRWKDNGYAWIDLTNRDSYCGDSLTTIRLKCAAVFFGTLALQPLGLLFSAINKIVKIASFSHFWHKSDAPYHFSARLAEWAKDLTVVVASPLIFVGMLLSSLYGAVISPLNGRKIYATFDRLAYSGGRQKFDFAMEYVNRTLFTPCFHPDPKSHLGGGDGRETNVW